MARGEGRWARFGPVSVHVASQPWPWPLELFRHTHPGRAALAARLAVDVRPGAGHDGPVARHGRAYCGPGFSLEEASLRTYRAVVADPPSLAGALLALLIDLGRRAPLVLLHGAALRVAGRAWCWVGSTGVGKSTWARRHERRALGSNAALVWPSSGRWWLEALPFTGKGDAAVAPGAVPLGGFVALGASRRRAGSVAEALAWLCRGAATARGLGPRLDLLEALARAHVVGGRNVLPRGVSSARAQSLTEGARMPRGDAW